MFFFCSIDIGNAKVPFTFYADLDIESSEQWETSFWSITLCKVISIWFLNSFFDLWGVLGSLCTTVQKTFDADDAEV